MATKPKKGDRVQERTYRTVRDVVEATLEAAVDDDDIMHRIEFAFEGEEEVDLKVATVERLLADPKAQKAFRKFVTQLVSDVQDVVGR